MDKTVKILKENNVNLGAHPGYPDLMGFGSEKEYCEIIKVNSQQLLNLVNDILDFSDFEGENIKFNIRQSDAVKIF